MSSSDERRREFLVRLLASGLLAVPLLRPRPAAAGGTAAPGALPAGRSIYRLQGDVRVNGSAATLATIIGPRDRVETGADGLVIFVVGKDAFILRANSTLELAPGSSTDPGGASATVGTLRILTGALLSVFGKNEHTVDTSIASIGIRGTGLYVETARDETYVCTCYGTADIVANGDPASRETIVSTHHNAPRYISAGAPPGRSIAPAPFKNHDDEELLLIESLVGRTTPFIVPSRSLLRRRRY
jgi:hypothetical protein